MQGIFKRSPSKCFAIRNCRKLLRHSLNFNFPSVSNLARRNQLVPSSKSLPSLKLGYSQRASSSSCRRSQLKDVNGELHGTPFIYTVLETRKVELTLLWFKSEFTASFIISEWVCSSLLEQNYFLLTFAAQNWLNFNSKVYCTKNSFGVKDVKLAKIEN